MVCFSTFEYTFTPKSYNDFKNWAQVFMTLLKTSETIKVKKHPNEPLPQSDNNNEKRLLWCGTCATENDEDENFIYVYTNNEQGWEKIFAKWIKDIDEYDLQAAEPITFRTERIYDESIFYKLLPTCNLKTDDIICALPVDKRNTETVEYLNMLAEKIIQTRSGKRGQEIGMLPTVMENFPFHFMEYLVLRVNQISPIERMVYSAETQSCLLVLRNKNERDIFIHGTKNNSTAKVGGNVHHFVLDLDDGLCFRNNVNENPFPEFHNQVVIWRKNDDPSKPIVSLISPFDKYAC